MILLCIHGLNFLNSLNSIFVTASSRPPRIPIPRQSSPAVVELLESLRSKRIVSFGIAYYGTAHGDILPLSGDNFVENQVIQNGFIIGIFRLGALRPIYDHQGRMVVVRLSNSGNIPLSAYEAQIIPYNEGRLSRIRDFGFQPIAHRNTANDPYIYPLMRRNP